VPANKSVPRVYRVSTELGALLDIRVPQVSVGCQDYPDLRAHRALKVSKASRVSLEFLGHWDSADPSVQWDHWDLAENPDLLDLKETLANQAKQDPKVKEAPLVCRVRVVR